MWFVGDVTTWVKEVAYDAKALRPTRNYVYYVSVINVWKPTRFICNLY
jgi:hypothetical protein